MLRSVPLVLLVMLFASGAMGQSQPPSPRPGQADKPPQTQPQPSQQHPDAGERGTEQAPVVVRSIKSKEDAAQDAKDRQEKASADRWMLIFSGAVAIGAFLQVGTFIVMIRTSRRQLRAYVFVTHSEIKAANPAGNILIPLQQIAAGTRPVTELRFTNTGQTPAYGMAIYGGIRMVNWPVNDADIPRPSVRDRRVSRASYGPNGCTSKVDIIDAPLTPEDIQALLNGTRAIVVHGEVRYRDSFGRRRRMRYRYFTGGLIGIRGITLAPHQRGNYAN
jgi:hypothetical protein